MIVNRLSVTDYRNIENIEAKKVVKNTEDIPIEPAHKYKPNDDVKNTYIFLILD